MPSGAKKRKAAKKKKEQGLQPPSPTNSQEGNSGWEDDRSAVGTNGADAHDLERSDSSQLGIDGKVTQASEDGNNGKCGEVDPKARKEVVVSEEMVQAELESRDIGIGGYGSSESSSNEEESRTVEKDWSEKDVVQLVDRDLVSGPAVQVIECAEALGLVDFESDASKDKFVVGEVREEPDSLEATLVDCHPGSGPIVQVVECTEDSKGLGLVDFESDASKDKLIEVEVRKEQDNKLIEVEVRKEEGNSETNFVDCHSVASPIVQFVESAKDSKTFGAIGSESNSSKEKLNEAEAKKEPGNLENTLADHGSVSCGIVQVVESTEESKPLTPVEFEADVSKVKLVEGEAKKKLDNLESSENKMIMPLPPTRRSSWLSCCGLFDLFTGGYSS